ncbi:MAG: insulinase family protein [Turicibacter sp.]|nr:insulinase family protein [Turicibacter sp.]
MINLPELTTLDNGLRIIVEDLPFVRSISFGIWVKNGSRDETAELNGISHFIEHMLFKGTEKRTAKEIADVMDAVGGQMNAYTTKEHTCFYTRTLDTHFDIALDVLSDMFFNAKFDNEEIKKERNVILEEISMYEDSPDDLVHDLLQQAIYKNDTLGYRVLGTPESIAAVDNAAIKAYMSRRYTPQTTLIAVAGNIKNSDVVGKIKEIFGVNFAAPTAPAAATQFYTPAFIKKEKDIEQVHLCFGYPGIPTGVPEMYDLAALNSILGGGMSSRLFQKIREERGLSYAIYTYPTSFIETGIFSIYAALAPQQTDEVTELILAEVKALFTDKVSQIQLDKTKEQIKSSFIMSLESAANRMTSIGRQMLMLDKIVTPDELITKIDQITLDSFYALAEKIFQKDQMSLAMVGNIPKN